MKIIRFNTNDSIEGYEEIFKYFCGGLILINPDKDKVICINDKAARIFNRDKEYFINLSLLPKSKNNELYNEIKEYLKNNQTFHSENLVYNIDGDEIISNVIAFKLMINDESLILIKIIDLIESKQKELKLKRNAEFIQSIIKVIPDTLNIINKEKIIIWSNHKDLEGKNICESFHNKYCEHIKNTECNINKVFIENKKVEFETTGINDTHFWHIITPCNVNGHVNTVLEIRRDITEKKKVIELDEIRKLVDRIINSHEKLNTRIRYIKNEHFK